MKIVVYTSIFGGYDELIDDQFQMEGVDFICFSDRNIESKTWNVIKSVPIYNDSNRNAKKYKILPHRYLSEYDYSVWIDGNFKVISDIRDLCNVNYAVYDHMQCFDKRNCIYDEANAILNFGKIHSQNTPERGIKNWKDNPTTIINQINKYISDGYPHQNGLSSNAIIFRNHNNSDVIKTMEDWWLEIKYGSRRDQLSFNYVAWKTQFNFVYLEGDIRNNKYFIQATKHKGKK